jgi:3-oxoacyl-[acyl-carrier protein] reductase
VNPGEKRVVIVTGAARGIGAATAKRLAQDGWCVVVNYARSPSAAEQTMTEIEAAGGEAMAVQADVGNAADVSRLFEAAERKFGAVSGLVNNAGVNELRMLEQIDAALLDKLFHTNVLGTVLTTAEFARRFQGTSGRVVNISSGAARASVPGGSVYGASKAAVEALTRGHALELGPRGVTVNAVAPGATDTELFRAHLPEETKARLVAITILGRLGQPDDIASVIAFLCSQEGGWMTGQVLDANGGRRM